MAKLAELLGKRIKEVRKQRGLRQEDIAGRGINYRYFQKIEAGKANITLETIENVAEALEIEPTDLLRFQLSDSEGANELNVLISDVIQEGDSDKIRKLVLFVREILG